MVPGRYTFANTSSVSNPYAKLIWMRAGKTMFIQCVRETRSRVDPRKILRELCEPQNARPPGTFTVNVPRRVVPAQGK